MGEHVAVSETDLSLAEIHGGQEVGMNSMTAVDNVATRGKPQPSRRSSRSVAKPNFRALENGGVETEELLDELGIAGDDGIESLGYGGQHGRKKRGGGRKGGVQGGLSKGGRVRKPAMLEDMEIVVSKLEDEVARLEQEASALAGRYHGLKEENAAMRKHIVSSQTI